MEKELSMNNIELIKKLVARAHELEHTDEATSKLLAQAANALLSRNAAYTAGREAGYMERVYQDRGQDMGQ